MRCYLWGTNQYLTYQYIKETFVLEELGLFVKFENRFRMGETFVRQKPLFVWRFYFLFLEA